jgi:hypothetical protein
MTICTICEVFQDLFELDCSHEFCHGCLVSHLRVKIEEKEELTCPNCNDEINQDKINDLLENDEDLLSMYKKSIFKEFGDARGMLDLVMCPNCNKICKNNDESNRIECANGCDDFCQICGQSHSPGFDWRYCPNELDIIHEFDSICLSLDGYIKRCPLCKIMIERVSGCNSIKCPNCKLKFCWSCLRSASEIKRMKHHYCYEYGNFLETNSDDDYKSGSDYSDVE